MAWSGLFDNEYSDGPHALQINPSGGSSKPSVYKKIAKKLKSMGHKPAKQLMDDMFEAGSTGLTKSAVTVARVEAVSGLASITNLGGVRTVETRTMVSSGSTDATDETNLERITTFDSQPSTYPTDASGNGGGGKLGY